MLSMAMLAALEVERVESANRQHNSISHLQLRGTSSTASAQTLYQKTEACSAVRRVDGARVAVPRLY